MIDSRAARAEDLPQDLDGADIGRVVRVVSSWIEGDWDAKLLDVGLKAVGDRVERDRARVGRAVFEWLETRQTRPGRPTARDVLQSALLRRLLSGSPKLPFVPPLAFRRPWYALVENKGKHRATFVPPAPGATTALVNDFAWDVVTVGPGQMYRLHHASSKITIRVIPNEEMPVDGGSGSRFRWLVERVA